MENETEQGEAQDPMACPSNRRKARVADLEVTVRWVLSVAQEPQADASLALSRIADETRRVLQKPTVT